MPSKDNLSYNITNRIITIYPYRHIDMAVFLICWGISTLLCTFFIINGRINTGYNNLDIFIVFSILLFPVFSLIIVLMLLDKTTSYFGFLTFNLSDKTICHKTIFKKKEYRFQEILAIEKVIQPVHREPLLTEIRYRLMINNKKRAVYITPKLIGQGAKVYEKNNAHFDHLSQIHNFENDILPVLLYSVNIAEIREITKKPIFLLFSFYK